MKKLIFLLVITLLCLWVTPAFALIRTRNVEADDYGSGDSKFDYKVAYQFATQDVAASISAVAMPVPTANADSTLHKHSLYYAMPFKGSIVGISIATYETLTGGSATAEVTINGYVTGVRTALEVSNVRHYPSGLVTTHSRVNANTLAYDDDSPPNWGGGRHKAVTHPYGKATPLVVGDRIGVNIETSSGVNTTDYVVTVIILQ